MQNVAQYLKHKNAWAELFGQAPVPVPSTPAEAVPVFKQLACDMSPENICCDGEASHQEVMNKTRLYKACWAELEEVYGRPVSESEAYIL